MRTQYTVYSDEVRDLCIRHRYYTAGDSRAYSAMFDKCRDACTLADVVAIAEDIKEHSHTDETAQDIAEDIANFCAYASIVEDEEQPETERPEMALYSKLFEIQGLAECLLHYLAYNNRDFVCSDCLRSINTVLSIYEQASNEEARAELQAKLEHLMDREL